MRLIIILITAGFLHVSAAGFAQKITLNEKNAKLTEVIKQIRIQSGYQFVYRNDLLENTANITIYLKDASLDEALKQALHDAPFTYEISDGTVIIQPKEENILDKVKKLITAIDVIGRVIDENGQPLSGATVQTKDGKISTTTEVNGFFTLKQVQSTTVIVISFIGYDKKEIVASTSNIGVIALTVATSKLDEVRVIAYGQTTDRLSVGNVNSISAKEIQEQPVNNPLLALEGRVPGLTISQVNGLPGSAVTIKIQSINTIGNNGTDPLYVIDGVPYAANMPTNNGTLLGAGNPGPYRTSGNPFSYINPNDIESISVLKDADATSIYGSRAANGAILITTKKGKAGKTKVDFNLQNGFGKDAKFLNVMNTQQYLAMRNQAYATDGLPIPSIKTDPSDFNYDVNGQWDQSKNTNWQKELLGGTAKYTDLNSTVSGGNELIQYLVGGTYHRETTVFPGDAADTKGSLHFSLTSASENKRFHFQLTGSYLSDNNLLPGSDLTSVAITLPPDVPDLRNPDGSLNWAPTPTGTSSLAFYNPLKYLLTSYQNKVKNLLSNVLLSYNIASGLNFKTNLGYNNLTQNEFSQNPMVAQAPENRATFPRGAFYGYGNSQNWIVEPQINYDRQTGQGKLGVLIGSTIQKTNTNNYQLNGVTYASDQLLSNIQSAGTITPGNSSNSDYKYAALFGRINYDWDGKYLLSISGRRDGSSRFGSANRFHDFWSAGIGWIFTEESFLKNSLTWLSFGKLKASYGTTGNDQIGDYNYLSLYNSIGFQVPYQNTSSSNLAGLSNPYLQWELTKKLNVGFDLGFFNDKITVNANYFHYRSSNELLGYNLPAFTGFGSITVNFPATIQSSGFEFSVSSVNVTGKDFSWNTSFNLTVPKDNRKLINFPGLADSPYGFSYVIGQSIENGKLFHYMGVNPTTGVYQFSDGKGGVTSTPESDPATSAYVIANTQPKMYGGLGNIFRFKDFSLDILLQFTKQKGFNIFKFGSPVVGNANVNQPGFLVNAWQKQGDNATVQRYATNFDFGLYGAYNDILNSDAGLEDASFIKLKNASFSWQLPAKWIHHIGCQNLRLFVQGQNLLTFTKYSNGVDPETQSANSLPPLRVITFGVNASF